MLGDEVAILFLEVARRSPWCRGTPAHVHWSLLRVLSSASLRFRSRLNGMAGDVSLSTGLRFSSCSPVRDRPPPPRICDFPTSGNSTTFPLIPAAPSGHVVGAEMLSPDLLSPLPCASRLRHGHYHRRLLLRLSSTSNGDDPTRLTTSRDIITPFYSRFIGLYQLHCHRTVCIVAACLPGCRHRNRVAVPRLRSAPDSLSPRDALRHALVNQRRWFIVVVRLKIAELSGYCSRFSAVSERRQCNVKIPILQ